MLRDHKRTVLRVTGMTTWNFSLRIYVFYMTQKKKICNFLDVQTNVSLNGDATLKQWGRNWSLKCIKILCVAKEFAIFKQ